jgi:hypothetical protein
MLAEIEQQKYSMSFFFVKKNFDKNPSIKIKSGEAMDKSI